MLNILKGLLEEKAANHMTDRGSTAVKSSDMGFSSTGCDEHKIAVACMCFHCMENMDIFSEEQISNIGDIINSI